MNNPVYRVTFQGKLIEGENISDVKRRLAERLNLNPSKIDILFSGKTTIIKKNASLAACNKIKAIFARCGAVCRVEPEGEHSNEESPPPRTEKAAVPPPLPPMPGTPTIEKQTTIPPHSAGETFCTTCGTAVRLNDLACPGCGKKIKKKESLPGCAIGAIVVGILFIAVAFMGILAAIAIPNFIAYRNKALSTDIRATLQNLHAAQHTYYNEHGKYTTDLSQLDFEFSNEKIKIEIVRADENCFEAKGSSSRLHQEYWIDCHGELKETGTTGHLESTGKKRKK